MFDLCKVDVKDKESLAIFRAKLMNLQEIFNSSDGNNDVHSIFNQYQEMIWNDTVYRTFNEARRLSEITNSKKTGISGTLIKLIDKNFFESQTMAIRRLTDPHEFRPQRTVYSFPSIIEEIESFIDVFTRENYICYNGIPFNNSNLPEWPDKGKHEERNKQFNRFSTKASTGLRNDLLDIKILKELEKDLKSFELIRSYTNKYIAHAAAPDNRRKIDLELQNLSLQELEDSYKKIVKIGKVLGDILDKYFLGEVATIPFDQLENWDMPLIIEVDKLRLYDYWDERTKMFKSWDRE